MQEQYNRLKEQLKETVLLFRLGDFYEAFNEDAKLLSKILGITLTGRGKDESRIPMAGIPYHSLPNYLPKLVEAGVKIAIADQMEEAAPGKLVERQVTKIITPGTVLDENSLDHSKNNYIACLYISTEKDATEYNFAYSDLTTGEFRVFKTFNYLILKNEINKINPSELLCSFAQLEKIRSISIKTFIQPLEDSLFNLEKSFKTLNKQFGTQTLKGFGISENDNLIIPAGSLITYLTESQKLEIKHIKNLSQYNYSDYMQLDPETIRNLEIIYPSNLDSKNSTVYSVLNNCETSMGERKLRRWLVNPLTNYEMLQDRLSAVEYFYDNQILLSNLRDNLKDISDIERIAGRVGVESASPKDLLSLKVSLIKGLETISLINKSNNVLPRRINHIITFFEIEKINNCIEIINNSISENAPLIVNDGGVIKKGFNSEIDELRNIRQNSRQVLAEIQKREIENTKVSTLKVSFNKVFGYYIEITRTHSDKVPSHYIRKQTLANAERYITQELKELEEKILSSEEKLIKLENEIFVQIRKEICELLTPILNFAECISELDVLTNLSYVAKQFRYVKPIILSEDEENQLEIINGRHLVVERIVTEFTPNSTEFKKDETLHILTGPNMSGKSTYIRQNALIVLLAQVGSYIPCDSCTLNIFDRIFTRVGASDNLAKGESTFMVEMTETANILNNATKKSLVILDEVGRGTSTYDGVAIAWSVAEYLATKINCKTLFATHYHELTDLVKRHNSISNYNVVVNDVEGEIIFTHKIDKGATNKSYGVHVAQIAGIPNEVTNRANEILETFENPTKEKAQAKKGESKNRSSNPKLRKVNPEQLELI